MSDLADQINAAHQEVLKAFNKGTLEHAIKAGELLNIAKENIKAEGKKWSEWLEENCPDIPQRTVHLYRQLATHKDHFKNWQRVAKPVNEELSLRGALKLIPKKKRAKATTETTKAAVEPPATRKSPTLEALLLDKAADEVFAAIRDNWDDDKLGALTTLLKEYLNSKGVLPPVPTPISEIARRI
jgi:hypothetical protein